MRLARCYAVDSYRSSMSRQEKQRQSSTYIPDRGMPSSPWEYLVCDNEECMNLTDDENRSRTPLPRSQRLETALSWEQKEKEQ